MTLISALLVVTPLNPSTVPIATSSMSSTNTPPLVVAAAANVITAVVSSLPDAPTPVVELSFKLLAVTSTPVSPPSVIAPVRAVSVTAVAPAFSSVTATDPPTIVTGSLNVELSTSTAPVPAAASPIVIELKPSCR